MELYMGHFVTFTTSQAKNKSGNYGRTYSKYFCQRHQ